MTDIPFIAAGIVAGAVAYVPFLKVLAPVIKGGQNADMLKGMLSLAVSAVALLAFTLVVFALFGEAFRMFLLGEAVGFIATMAVSCVRVVRSLREPHEVER